MIFSTTQHKLGFAISAERPKVVREDITLKNTQTVIKHCQIFAGRGKGCFPGYKSEVRVCLSLYRKSVFAMFLGKDQPPFILSMDGAVTLNVLAR